MDEAPVVELGLGGWLRIGRARIAVADTFTLLRAIARTRSVQGAATEIGLSYRAAWERVRTLEADLGHQLVRKTRGHGTTLTEAGAALHEALSAAAAALAPSFAREARAMQAHLAARFAVPLRLAVAASHDPLLMQVLSEWGGAEVAVIGSRDAVARLIDGRADAAGFHCGAAGPAAAGPPFTDLVADPAFRVHPLFEREQGLLVAPGNPLGLATPADLRARKARFVNRQKGSGTRAWFDRLLAETGIPPDEIVGYGFEEFTHQAVAAVIASGAADAGLGARAAAERFGLGFVSVGWEVYCLATSAALPADRLDRLLAMLAERVGDVPGYRPPDARAAVGAGPRPHR
ncbi:ModE molybdate transport repressor domain-containing protein [Methylobacterium sp. ap11]|uniref:helix-turn-helix transcriptional regulator n=1 Tax=Methylobacterium sp. ap11 TaxID=1761799 RepID=UPI0008C8DE0A|nr:helix-turn-helix transcriptional regulator [Methylobacterium sp. ap11]SEP46497.1 ModE molybdate transport repressor domain-containing protein [Methylobacterium sp. ap11]